MFNAFLTTPPAIDESIFDVIVNGCKAVLGLFTEFPINVFLGVAIVGICIGVVKKLKK